MKNEELGAHREEYGVHRMDDAEDARYTRIALP